MRLRCKFFFSSFSTKRQQVYLLTADFSAFYLRYVELPWGVQRFLTHNNLEGNKLTLYGEYIGRFISSLQTNTNNVTVHQKSYTQAPTVSSIRYHTLSLVFIFYSTGYWTENKRLVITNIMLLLSFVSDNFRYWYYATLCDQM